MRNFWYRVIKAGVGAIVLSCVGVAAYLQHPLFGELPSGERLARLERSAHYVNGALRNQTDTPVLTTDQLNPPCIAAFGINWSKRYWLGGLCRTAS